MPLEWITIALTDVLWILAAFCLGMLARAVQLPPLIGFLAAGFLLKLHGGMSGEMLEQLSSLGITLLLFTIGLKLNPRSLLRPQVLAVGTLHMAGTVGVLSAVLLILAGLGLPFIRDLEPRQILLIGFALSFSSTVLVAKALESRGEMRAVHGRIAIGILVLQDLVAVAFLTASTGQFPSPLALVLLLFIPLRPLLLQLLCRTGHGELLVLYGLLLALGGAELFELVGLKGDLGALLAGILIAGHERTEELAKTLLGFKDLFLLGFFLSIGQAGIPTPTMVLLALLLTPLVLLKSAGFIGLFLATGLRARTALVTSLNLTNFSEFGLIVAALATAKGWLSAEWLVVLALTMSFSFVLHAPLNAAVNRIYHAQRQRWYRWQRKERIREEQIIDIRGTEAAVIGMGAVGTGTFDAILDAHQQSVIGVDINSEVVERQLEQGRTVVEGDPGDRDFWIRLNSGGTLQRVLITLPHLAVTLSVIRQLRAAGFKGQIAATARYPDQRDAMLKAGADLVFDTFTEAGVGFASHVLGSLPEDDTRLG